MKEEWKKNGVHAYEAFWNKKYIRKNGVDKARD